MPPIAGSFQGGTGGMQSFQSLIPPMGMPNFTPAQNFLPGAAGQAGFMPPPIGGQWNQIAQQMAGPMYLPHAPPAGIPYPIRPPAPTNAPVAAPPPPQAINGSGLAGLAALGGTGGLGRMGGGAGGGFGGGAGGMRGNMQMFAPPQSIYQPVFGLDGSPASVISLPFAGGAGGSTNHWLDRPATQVV